MRCNRSWCVRHPRHRRPALPAKFDCHPADTETANAHSREEAVMGALILAASLWVGGGADSASAGWEAACRAVRPSPAPREMDWVAYYRRRQPLAPGGLPYAA